jgi:hypothetical protein
MAKPQKPIIVNAQPVMMPHLKGSRATKPRRKKRKRRTPGIPTWSPTVVLTRPDNA